MGKSNWNVDIENESVINDLIIEHLTNSGMFEKVKRSTKEENHKGSDIQLVSERFFKDNLLHHVDLKTATNYRKVDGDESIPTFAFELQFSKPDGNGGIKKEGWVFGEKYTLTEWYLISWIWVYDEEKRDRKVTLSKEDISQIEFVLIKKEVIKKYLKYYKVNKKNYEKVIDRFNSLLNKERLKKNSKLAFIIKEENRKLNYATLSLYKPTEYRLTETTNKEDRKLYLPQIYYTAWLAEQPYNILISKKSLIDIVNDRRYKGIHRIIDFKL